MDIREFRAVVASAFQDEEFLQLRLVKGGNKVWALPGEDVIRFFAPHELRRPWGFRLNGVVGIEIPALREWLVKQEPSHKKSIFCNMFVGYYSTNEDVLSDFAVENESPVPADLWVGLVKDRLLRIPPSLDALLMTYRTNREDLGWLAHAHEKAAWDFLRSWSEDATASLSLPRMLPNGQII